jgi:hypothetical protein
MLKENRTDFVSLTDNQRHIATCNATVSDAMSGRSFPTQCYDDRAQKDFEIKH